MSVVYDWLSVLTVLLALAGIILWMMFIDKEITKSTFPFFVITAACCVVTAILCIALAIIKKELDTHGLEGFFLGFLIISYLFFGAMSFPFIGKICSYI